MRDAKLEKRMAELEKELAMLRTKVDGLTGAGPWWERIAGTFHGDRAYRQAMELGREYRQGQRPGGTEPNGS